MAKIFQSFHEMAGNLLEPFHKMAEIKIIHVLLILNILRAHIGFADSLIFVDDFYKKSTYSSQ